MMRDIHTKPFTESIAKMKDVVSKELTGRLPVAAIQYYRIYALCTRILKESGTAAYKLEDQSVENLNAHTGDHFVERLLDVIAQDERSANKLGRYRVWVKIAEMCWCYLQGEDSRWLCVEICIERTWRKDLERASCFQERWKHGLLKCVIQFDH